MKKLFFLLLFSGVMLLGLFSKEKVIFNSSDNIKSYITIVDIMSIEYFEKEDVYRWTVIYYDKLKKGYIEIKCFVARAKPVNKEYLEKGTYIIKANIIYDAILEYSYFYPIWIYCKKSNNIEIERKTSFYDTIMNEQSEEKEI